MRANRPRGPNGGRRPGAGRKPTGLPRKRETARRITIDLTPEEAAPVEEEARAEGVSAACILRRAIGVQRDAVGELRVVWRRREVADIFWGPREALEGRRLVSLGHSPGMMDWGIGIASGVGARDIEHQESGPALEVIAWWWAQRPQP